MKKIVAIVAVLAALIAGYVWFFVYNKAHVDYTEAEAAFTGNADALLTEILADESLFQEKYVNQAVEVSGVVSEVGSSSFKLGSGFICTVDETKVLEMPESGSSATVKGRIVGLDEDILTGEKLCTLDQCTLVAPK